MSDFIEHIYITSESVNLLKNELKILFPTVISSHLSEILAQSLDFRTYASLLELIKSTKRTDPVEKSREWYYAPTRILDGELLKKSLMKFGYLDYNPTHKMCVDLSNIIFNIIDGRGGNPMAGQRGIIMVKRAPIRNDKNGIHLIASGMCTSTFTAINDMQVELIQKYVKDKKRTPVIGFVNSNNVDICITQLDQSNPRWTTVNKQLIKTISVDNLLMPKLETENISPKIDLLVLQEVNDKQDALNIFKLGFVYSTLAGITAGSAEDAIEKLVNYDIPENQITDPNLLSCIDVLGLGSLFLTDKITCSKEYLEFSLKYNSPGSRTIMINDMSWF